MKKIKQIGNTLPKVKGSKVAKALGAKCVGPINKTGHKCKTMPEREQEKQQQIDLTRFIINQIGDLIEFHDYWEIKNKKRPIVYPMKMLKYAWEEEFVMFKAVAAICFSSRE